MKFHAPRIKTMLSLSSAVGLALVLVGCSTPPNEDNPGQNAAPPAESSQLPAEKTAPSQQGKAEANASIVDSNPHSITWLSSYDKALQTADKNNQPVMVDFYADWCTACKMMDKDIYTAPNVIKESKKFVNLKLDADKETDIAARYKIYALPTLIFLDGNGRVLWRIEGVPSTSHFVETMQKVQSKVVSRT